MDDSPNELDWVNVAAEVYRSPRDLLREGTKRVFLCELRYGVSETHSDAEPPTALPAPDTSRDLVPDFESLLGVYHAADRKIVLFDKGITWLAEQRGWNHLMLELIVRLHEWAHALQHLGALQSDWVPDSHAAITLQAMDMQFEQTPTDLAEQIAQISTLLGLRQLAAKAKTQTGKLFATKSEEVFFQLMGQQSAKYRLPKSLRDMDDNRLRLKLAQLIRLSSKGLHLPLDEISDFFA